jgi:hypothetical protein
VGKPDEQEKDTGKNTGISAKENTTKNSLSHHHHRHYHHLLISLKFPTITTPNILLFKSKRTMLKF